MAEDTIYVNESDAKNYADKVGGIVVPHDADNDGEKDSFKVIIEGSTRGPNPSELIPENPTVDDFRAAATQAEYLADVEKAGKPEGKNMGGVVVDELGYRRGGMNFNKRGAIKYSQGGAVKGKNFRGSF
tara:strand:- start:740 stop:1126 length:387 start_codon:yes stop_codon:yes gene_type:complete